MIWWSFFFFPPSPAPPKKSQSEHSQSLLHSLYYCSLLNTVCSLRGIGRHYCHIFVAWHLGRDHFWLAFFFSLSFPLKELRVDKEKSAILLHLTTRFWIPVPVILKFRRKRFQKKKKTTPGSHSMLLNTNIEQGVTFRGALRQSCCVLSFAHGQASLLAGLHHLRSANWLLVLVIDDSFSKKVYTRTWL